MDNLTILFVEDEIDLRKVIQLTSEKYPGINFELVESGETAMNFMKKTKYDAIISDYYLPGISGVELLKLVREEYPQTLRYLLTGAVDPQIYEKAKVIAEVKTIFEKPLILESIIDKIKQDFNI